MLASCAQDSNINVSANFQQQQKVNQHVSSYSFNIESWIIEYWIENSCFQAGSGKMEAVWGKFLTLDIQGLNTIAVIWRFNPKHWSRDSLLEAGIDR